MKPVIDTHNLRAKKARLAKYIGKLGYTILQILIVILLLLIIVCFISKHHNYIYLLAALAIFSYILAVWWKRELSILPVSDKSIEGRLSIEVLSRLKSNAVLTPKTLWQAIADHWQTIFFTNHLLLAPSLVSNILSDKEYDLNLALNFAAQLAEQNHSDIIELGYVAAGLLSSCPSINEILVSSKLKTSDINEVASWLGRITENMRREKQSFGGVGRDWAFGFTPLLNRYGENISLAIAKYGANFGWLTDSQGVLAVESSFSSHTAVIALIGPTGVGKSSTVYAFAQKLIEGRSKQGLLFNQVIGLEPSTILSTVKNLGDLEYLINRIAAEASKAGHIILFLDNSQLFFNDGPGSFNATNILLPIFQNRSVRIILSFTPEDYQRLKLSSPELANIVTPIVLSEQPESSVMRILEDNAVRLENQNKLVIAFEALREAYRLSGQYNQTEAYPGKAIKLLEQSISNASDHLVSAESVQKTIEQTTGVKTGSAAPIEADKLLHLEDRIHQRMINQNRAVNVVASALRRSRAGVSDPNKPIGSFLFLGPTGVGKTELAKSLAAEYFGDQTNFIRLDMSEYQQSEDVKRLLDSGEDSTSSLIMSVRQRPFSVLLLDEIEKAHPNILNLLLQLLDEGQLTDNQGGPTSFKNCIIIATSNAGAQDIRNRVQGGQNLESFEAEFIEKMINSGQFKPELLNRFDEIVLFRPLLPNELFQIVNIMMKEVNKTLKNQNIYVELTDEAIKKIVEVGYDPRLGARPMRRVIQRAVEDKIAKEILANKILPGDHVKLNEMDLDIS